jgi:Spy/CpxP family protein refolding chaperone
MAANSRIIVTLGAVFLAGFATGMLVMRFGLHEQMHPVAAAPPQTKGEPVPNQEALLDKYRTELNLTAEQTQKLAAILDDYQHYYQAVQEEIEDMRLRDQIDDLRATGKSRILEILNPDQRAKFEKMTGKGVDPTTPGAPK